MPRNKPRLELALYARPKHPGTFHYALFASPKPHIQEEPASLVTKHHVKNTLQNIDGALVQPWRYERVNSVEVEREQLQRLLVRIVVGKIPDIEALEDVLRTVPIYQIDDADSAKAQSFSCSRWAMAALETLKAQGAVTGMAACDKIQEKALEYIEMKAAAGRWSTDWKGKPEVPILSLLSGRELVP